MASGGRPAALHVTDDTGRHLRYTSRAKREADVSLSHPLHHGASRCTMEHHDATGVTTPRQTVKASPHRHKWMLSHGAPADPSDPWNSHAAPVSHRALDGILILAAFRFQNLFSTRETTPGSCNNTLRRPLRRGAQRPRTSGGRPAALRVTGDATRRLRYPSRAKRPKPTSRCRTVCTMARPPRCDGCYIPRQTV